MVSYGHKNTTACQRCPKIHARSAMKNHLSKIYTRFPVNAQYKSNGFDIFVALSLTLRLAQLEALVSVLMMMI